MSFEARVASERLGNTVDVVPSEEAKVPSPKAGGQLWRWIHERPGFACAYDLSRALGSLLG